MKHGVAYFLTLVVGGIIGASLMHHFGRCQVQRPLFRDAAFFQQHADD